MLFQPDNECKKRGGDRTLYNIESHLFPVLVISGKHRSHSKNLLDTGIWLLRVVKEDRFDETITKIPQSIGLCCEWEYFSIIASQQQPSLFLSIILIMSTPSFSRYHVWYYIRFLNVACFPTN